MPKPLTATIVKRNESKANCQRMISPSVYPQSRNQRLSFLLERGTVRLWIPLIMPLRIPEILSEEIIPGTIAKT
jgi:hypothetical protein